VNPKDTRTRKEVEESPKFVACPSWAKQSQLKEFYLILVCLLPINALPITVSGVEEKEETKQFSKH